MSEMTKKCSEAAKWMLDHEVKPANGYHYWRWAVLTKQNSDPSSPGMSESDAGLIFADFVQRGMLVACLDDKGQEAYRINHAREDTWKQIAKPGSHLAWTWGQRFFDWVMGGIVGAIIGAIGMACAG